MKIAIIAEKPSVAREIAAIVGANTKRDGYMEGNDYLVTWAFGHLVQLALPEHYGAKGFMREHLPIIPHEFMLIPRQIHAEKGYKDDPSAVRQLKTIEQVFVQCEKIIVATDAGREGELIFRYIYDYLASDVYFERLWISSLTEKAIREGLIKLRPGTDYNNLHAAAEARSCADWLVGINASQALSVAAGNGVYSLGRVQTPTLAMICSRYLENKNFKPVSFWQMQLVTSIAGKNVTATGKDRFFDKAEVTSLYNQIRHADKVSVVKTECKETKQEPPLLYDLTALQKEANSKHGFSADKTLSLAQKLYESKLLTYPRTGSRYISDDVFLEIRGLIDKLKRYTRFAACAEKLSGTNLNIRSVDDKKVSDHHALLITENLPDSLSSDERIIYEMVAARMLEAFHSLCVKDTTAVTFGIGDIQFEVKGSVIKHKGWREVLNEKNNDADDGVELPEIHEGETHSISSVGLQEKQTKPKPLHTESSLLGAMETAGKELENEEQRLALKICGIGTPATRAAIIETLFTRDYIRREKKSLVPTEKGLSVYDIVKDKRIADVEMTGYWEDAFLKIERGEQHADNFSKGIEVYTRQITEELLNVDISFSANSHSCPKCGKQGLRFLSSVCKCPDESCDFVMFRNCGGKKLSDDVFMELLSEGKTRLLKGFTGKAGKRFDAYLVLNSECKIAYEFPERKENNKRGK
ncbi:topoisomerase C-terminal repeat-containing protein [Dysgonomonas sp. Marseille-P4677]|uniref:type IA DNA topoisomerase n=1 Tax=Dysgonomonas sp. Marseille-P4677 TaxID=2364790 RepID=UPI0019144CE3|nr:type IA DNA topoisomerase [Dysgonomonas sp. Marseille-P4677]MBK5719539.1 topoisomerase C-terminal repeat-containing protein [Dysgonomonas sp. Marseille-P4677]